MFWKVLLVVLVVYHVWRHFDKKKNPAKWAKIDAEVSAMQAARKEREFQRATERVPPSEWMRMNKHEKATVLKRREDAMRDRE